MCSGKARLSFCFLFQAWVTMVMIEAHILSTQVIYRFYFKFRAKLISNFSFHNPDMSDCGSDNELHELHFQIQASSNHDRC